VDKNNCTQRVRDGNEWERTGKPLKSLGGCNFRKGNYLRFCESPIRNAEARSSTLLCSTNYLSSLNKSQSQLLLTRFSQVANTWPEKTVLYGKKPQRKITNGNQVIAIVLATH
jgi:hypothetical protein